MYNKTFNSCLVLNSHTDLSKNYSANMRLFETTGIGTGILTEYSKNIHELFDKDEIITYIDYEDCMNKIEYYKMNLDELNEIALKGQKKTLKNHSSFIRVSEIDNIIKNNF